MPEDWLDVKYWTLEEKPLLSLLKSSKNGLSQEEAKRRLDQFGSNAIPDKDKKSWLDILIAQFTNPLLLILIVATFVSAYLGDVFDTVIIIVIIVISALLGFFQEYKAEKVLSELKKYFSYSTIVLRDGIKQQIDTRELVPGDIVFVRLGDLIPADIRLLESEGIAIDESILTGESREITKSPAPMQFKESPGGPQDIKNGLFMGTTVIGGYAKGIVIATGTRTFFGKTVAIFSSKVPESDFQIGIRKFGDTLVKIISITTVFIFLANYSLGHGENNPLIESLLFSLAVAIGIAPEALPVIITITLSSGSISLAKKNVITKKLASIEDLGNMDILCTDKTGTLTDEMQLDRYVDLDKKDSHDVFEYALLCNSAVGTMKITGNAVDVAIKKHGIASRVDVSRFTKVQEIEFDFVRRRMGQVVREGKKTILIVKGAPEAILEKCSKIKIDGKGYTYNSKISEIKKMISDYNLDGYSTIGIAYKKIKAKKEYTKADEEGLIFVGFVLLKNHPKDDVARTLERLKKLNVNLKIVTGDDALVTKKLCQDVGLVVEKDGILTGNQIKQMNEEELEKAVESHSIFARVTPDQKLLIIEALRKNGHVVGFLGDGINDAPSLRTADVGISVDTAADIAKGASHMILLEKGLDVICDGVEEGRKIFGNITKYILNTMSANQGNMITIVLSSLFLPFIPLLPSQILLNNLITDLPLMSVSSDNVDAQYTKKPQRWNISLIVKFMIFFGLISTIFDFALILIMYYVMQLDVETFRSAWFLESVLSEMLIVLSLRTYLPFFKNIPSGLLVVSSIGACAISFAAVYIAPIALFFHLVPISLGLLAFIAAILIAYFAATELGKVVFFRYIHKIEG